MAHAVVEVLVLPLEVGLAPAAAHVVFLALGVLMESKVFLGELAFAVLACKLCFLAAGEMFTDVFSQELLLAVHALHSLVFARLLDVLVDQISVQLDLAPFVVVRALHLLELALNLLVDLKLSMRENGLAPSSCVSAPDLEVGEHVSDDFVRLEFEVRITSTLERTCACLPEPLLQTVHAEAILTLVALQGVHQYAVAYPALHILRHVLVVHHPLRVNDVDLNRVLIVTHQT